METASGTYLFQLQRGGPLCKSMPQQGPEELLVKTVDIQRLATFSNSTTLSYIGVIKTQYEIEARRKEEKARRKLKNLKAEAKRFEAEEAKKCEKQALKKKEKLRKEAEQRAEMRKDLRLEMCMDLHEMNDEFIAEIKQTVLPACFPPQQEKGKQKMEYISEGYSSSSDSQERSNTSVTQKIKEKTGKLSITDKRKRGPEPVFEDSPPMESPAKRTPMRGTVKPVKLCMCLTRTKANQGENTPVGRKTRGSRKRVSPMKTPLTHRKSAIKKASPATTSATKVSLARMRYKDVVMKELKDLEAPELQKICKEEGIHYDKKIDVIFYIAEHRAQLTLGDGSPVKADVIALESDAGTVQQDEVLE
ncbi:hypothetical protein CBR_g38467 [Chara braunii]|uniref:Uncharacterized protein n=1 Tax=Chara braunii TaxID=69332 RepID=A0A388JP03_CHABU|nr:hypothetical protein CBR_g38467 [Chara braunii]|eukprot:GBG59442.1 hypothetical protein CBR_g38467 [Chara braunii]